jgi:hypothetical protein
MILQELRRQQHPHLLQIGETMYPTTRRLRQGARVTRARVSSRALTTLQHVHYHHTWREPESRETSSQGLETASTRLLPPLAHLARRVHRDKGLETASTSPLPLAPHRSTPGETSTQRRQGTRDVSSRALVCFLKSFFYYTNNYLDLAYHHHHR